MNEFFILFGLVVIAACCGLGIGILEQRKADRKIECTTYIQGKYLEDNCWKGDTIVQLYIK